jgi:glycerate 2-kinase
LVSKGNRAGRRLALDMIEYAMDKMDAFEAVSRLVRIQKKQQRLIIGNLSYDFSSIGDIYVVGAGKATFSMAQAMDSILGNRIKEGVVIVKRGQIPRETNLGGIKVLTASHPVPDTAGLNATKKILEIAEKAKKGDIVFSLISGGASAMMPMPENGISLSDEVATTKLLLNLGISVEEINAVRNHISSVKGGRLALKIHPAEILNLIIVDEVDSSPWGPTVPDSTIAEDAIQILNRGNIWNKVPTTVRRHLTNVRDNPRLDTPKHRDFQSRRIKYHNFILGDNAMICRAAETRARELGLNTMILTSVLEGESKDAGIVVGSLARGIEGIDGSYRRLNPPCALIAGGETTVKMSNPRSNGIGGPSQEFVLGVALKISGSKKIVAASIDTDGIDGPTDVAGGLVDGYTSERARKAGIDLHKELSNHNSNFALRKLGDTIKTGMTGTNVMDLNVIIVTK